MKFDDLKALDNDPLVEALREQLRDYDLDPKGRTMTFGSGVDIEGCVLVASAVVATMLRNPATVANAIMALDKGHRDQIRVLLDKLESVGL
jgi:hypothetical protein